MKLFLLSLLIFTTSLQAQEMGIPDYDWKMNDITSVGMTKEKLFTAMDRSLIKVNQSICSNRAQVWVYDMKKNHNIDSSKLFLFFTEKTGRHGGITWWYHVTPVINENGKMWVMDAGFPGRISKPLTVSEWLIEFNNTDNCKQIKASETDLVERIFKEEVYPEQTSYGKYDCYYKIVPPGYWTPGALAQNLLGRNESGTPVSYNREEIDKEEVYAACVEASTNPFGRLLGGGKRKCAKYLH